VSVVSNVSVKVKIIGAGVVAAILLLTSVGLAANSFSTLATHARREATTHQMATAVASAYEQWTLDDDQSNMYAAVVALRDPAQRALAEATYGQAAQARAAVTPQLVRAEALATSDGERALLRRIENDLKSYDYFTRLMRQRALAGDVTRTIHVVTVENLAPSNDLPLAFTTLLNTENATVASINTGITASVGAGNLLLLALALVGLLALIPSVLIARAIARPLRRLTRASERLAVGDTDVEGDLPSPSRDEVGALAVSFRAMVAHQREMARVAEVVAAGDLTIGVTPKGEADTLGHAFAAMLANLRDLVGHVARSSEAVAAGTNGLSATTAQIGQASSQIARAIEEVARGASDQSRGATEAMGQIADLDAAVAQVASGAATQLTTVTRAEGAMTDLRASLDDTTRSATAVTSAAERAARTAQDGGSAVERTLRSIDGVRAAVLKSATQVETLGRHSAEVGQIVVAIDDIAAQTNLLALNAAIEAARAGEHGRGFTVVAAEVRKLAERASDETKGITQRVGAIQRQVAEVVAAMTEGSAEVEQSAILGGQARAALEDILGVVGETNAQACAITGAIARMSDSAGAAGAAAAHIAEVAAQTARATEGMRAAAERVGTAIEGIAAVSEQSAAGAEEVSASTQEQTASAHEVTAEAERLAGLADDLRAQVARFTLDDQPQEQIIPLDSGRGLRSVA